DANTVGIMPAPRNPWTARHRIICSIEEAKPHRKLAAVKPPAEIANNSRVPSARDRKPDNGIAITSAIRYEVCTHDTSVELADRPAWMSESEAETIWMSRIDMNIPNTMMTNATTRFGSIRSETSGVGIMAGDAVVAFAMVCSVQVGLFTAAAVSSLSPFLRRDVEGPLSANTARGVRGDSPSPAPSARPLPASAF